MSLVHEVVGGRHLISTASCRTECSIILLFVLSCELHVPKTLQDIVFSGYSKVLSLVLKRVVFTETVNFKEFKKVAICVTALLFRRDADIPMAVYVNAISVALRLM